MTDQWYQEKTRNVIISHRIKAHVLSVQTKFQLVDIIDSYDYGRMLLLDNMTQSAEGDEYIYHEMMVHPALFTHQPVENVCIIGGSEGATLREVLKHDLKRVVMIDIDEQLVQICKEYLTAWSQGAFEDPRVDLRFLDGRKFLEETEETFDAILIDISDPLEDRPSTLLFTKEFYDTVYKCLSPQGCVVVQSESTSPGRLEPHARIYNTLKSIFPFVRPYIYTSHSFHEIYSFALASKSHDPMEKDVPTELKKKESAFNLKYYSSGLHRGIFHLPRYLYYAYEKYSQIITDNDVVYYPDKEMETGVKG